MGRAFVYSILAIVLIAGHYSTGFPSNIHEKLTEAERLRIFGSKDSVPDYEVFPVSLPGVRRRRETGNNIALEFEIDGNRTILNLERTKRYLASKHTPVWSVESDEHAYQSLRYDPLPKAMSDIGEIQIYHDEANDAAVIVFKDPDGESVIEGMFTAHYVIRSLPIRLMVELQKIGENLLRLPSWKKRSIDIDKEEDNYYFVVYKIAPALKHVATDLVETDNFRREKRMSDTETKRDYPKAVYAKILFVTSVIMKHADEESSVSPMTETLRRALGLWNRVDLLYRALNNPKVYLNIAGIIIAGETGKKHLFQKLFPRNNSGPPNVPNVEEYFYEEKTRFPMNRYDMIIVMVDHEFIFGDYHEWDSKVDYWSGYVPPDATACHSIGKASKTKTIPSVGIFDLSDYQNFIRVTARVTARLLGARQVINEAAPSCDFNDGNIMDRQLNISDQKIQWSDCNRKDLSRFFSTKKSVCLRNKPQWIKTTGEVLPGRWLTLSGQCNNEGYAKACKSRRLFECTTKRCFDEKIGKCVDSKLKPLPGTECGILKHCNTKQKCVHD